MMSSFSDRAFLKSLGLSRSCRHSVGSSDREFFILLGAGGATDAYRPDNLPINDERNAALQRREIIEGSHSDSPLVDRVFEELRRPFEQDRSPRLTDRNVGAGGKGVIQPFEGNEIASFVDHGNGAARRVLAFSLGAGGRNHFFRAVQSQPFFLNGLRRSGRRECQ